MDARPKRVSEILHTGDQYIIPLFQRHYSWKKDHWERLKNDLWALLENDSKPQHFLGPLVCTATSHVPGHIPAYQLIDGQQRLTTIIIMLAALRDVACKRKLTALETEIYEYYLVHKLKEDSEHYKLLPRLGDREALIAIIEGHDLCEFRDFGVYHAWQYFHRHIEHHARVDAEKNLRQLFDAISSRLSLVMITIDGENPYEIFESLNSTGLPLQESDLIRNYIFMQIPLNQQSKFDKEHWQSFEKLFEKTEDYVEISQTAFYRNYLMREGEYSKADAAFVDFKKQNRERELSPVDQVAELKKFAAYEVMLRRPKTCKKPELASVLYQVGLSEITTAYCLVHKLMQLNEEGGLSADDLIGCLRDLVSFAGRRAVCGETGRAYNLWFLDAIGKIKSTPRQDLQACLLRRGWPTDDIFCERLKTFPLYKRESLRSRLILEQLELAEGHKEKIELSTLTIEHVMPQTIKDDTNGKAWKAMLGEECAEVHEAYLHTLGNLSLTGYNTELSNSPYEVKKTELLNSNVQLNKYFFNIDAWDKQAIEDRCEELSAKLVGIWNRPETTAVYIPSAEAEGDAELRPHLAKKLRYWNRLVDLLREGGSDLAPDEVTPETYLDFPILEANEAVYAGAWTNKQHRQLVVYIHFRKSVGRRCESYLEARKIEIEEALGYAVEWRPNGSHEIRISDNEINFNDENDWHIQHDWLADRLEDFQRVLFPLVTDFFAQETSRQANDGELTATRAMQLEYWETLQQLITDSGSKLKPQAPRPHSWMTITIGTRGAYSYLFMDTQRHRIGVRLKINSRKYRFAIFNFLKKQQETIESEIGCSLDWEELPDKKSSYVSLRLENSDPNIRENWAEQHQWMIEKAEAFSAVFSNLISNMGTGAWQSEEDGE